MQLEIWIRIYLVFGWVHWQVKGGFAVRMNFISASICTTWNKQRLYDLRTLCNGVLHRLHNYTYPVVYLRRVSDWNRTVVGTLAPRQLWTRITDSSWTVIVWSFSLTNGLPALDGFRYILPSVPMTMLYAPYSESMKLEKRCILIKKFGSVFFPLAYSLNIFISPLGSTMDNTTVLKAVVPSTISEPNRPIGSL